MNILLFSSFQLERFHFQWIDRYQKIQIGFFLSSFYLNIGYYFNYISIFHIYRKCLTKLDHFKDRVATCEDLLVPGGLSPL